MDGYLKADSKGFCLKCAWGVKMKKTTKEHGGDDEGGLYAYNADVVNETYAEH